MTAQNPLAGSILVVDDNEMNLDSLARHLRGAGCTVVTAACGVAALQSIATTSFDVVLLDVMMPEMDGEAVLKAVRGRHGEDELPVIMVTARHDSEDIVRLLEAGANDYVTKPIDMPVLLARVRTQLKVRQLSQLKEEFIGIASHELKSPLTGMVLATQMLKGTARPGGLVTEEAWDLMKQLEDWTRSMKRMVEDFLDIQVLRRGTLPAVATTVDVTSVAQRVFRDCEAYSRSKGISVQLTADGTHHVRGDPDRLHQVLENLVNNAIKFGVRGQLVSLHLHEEDGEVVLAVSDNGPGIPPDDLPHLFDRYRRSSARPTGGESSSGLGLAICKEIVGLHRGQIGAYNNPDGGATFWVAIPSVAPPSAAPS